MATGSRRGARPRRSAFENFDESQWLLGVRENLRNALFRRATPTHYEALSPRVSQPTTSTPLAVAPQDSPCREAHQDTAEELPHVLARSPRALIEVESSEDEVMEDPAAKAHLQRTSLAMQELLALGGIVDTESNAPVTVDGFADQVWRVDRPSQPSSSQLFSSFTQGESVDMDALLRFRAAENMNPSPEPARPMIEVIADQTNMRDKDASERVTPTMDCSYGSSLWPVPHQGEDGLFGAIMDKEDEENDKEVNVQEDVDGEKEEEKEEDEKEEDDEEEEEDEDEEEEEEEEEEEDEDEEEDEEEEEDEDEDEEDENIQEMEVQDPALVKEEAVVDDGTKEPSELSTDQEFYRIGAERAIHLTSFSHLEDSSRDVIVVKDHVDLDDIQNTDAYQEVDQDNNQGGDVEVNKGSAIKEEESRDRVDNDKVCSVCEGDDIYKGDEVHVEGDNDKVNAMEDKSAKDFTSPLFRIRYDGAWEGVSQEDSDQETVRLDDGQDTEAYPSLQAPLEHERPLGDEVTADSYDGHANDANDLPPSQMHTAANSRGGQDQPITVLDSDDEKDTAHDSTDMTTHPWHGAKTEWSELATLAEVAELDHTAHGALSETPLDAHTRPNLCVETMYEAQVPETISSVEFVRHVHAVNPSSAAPSASEEPYTNVQGVGMQDACAATETRTSVDGDVVWTRRDVQPTTRTAVGTNVPSGATVEYTPRSDDHERAASALGTDGAEEVPCTQQSRGEEPASNTADVTWGLGRNVSNVSPSAVDERGLSEGAISEPIALRAAETVGSEESSELSEQELPESKASQSTHECAKACGDESSSLSSSPDRSAHLTRSHCPLQRLTLSRAPGAPTFLVRSCVLDPKVLADEGAECADLYVDTLDMTPLAADTLPEDVYTSLCRIVGPTMLEDVYVSPQSLGAQWMSSAGENEDVAEAPQAQSEMPAEPALEAETSAVAPQRETERIDEAPPAALDETPSRPSQRKRVRPAASPEPGPLRMRLRTPGERRPPRHYSPEP